MKFDGPIGLMLKRHNQYAKRGRSRPAAQACFSMSLSGAVTDVMTGIRWGLDSGKPTALSPKSIELVERRSEWLAVSPSATTPLSAHVQHVSRDFRSQIPTGDELPRVQKKALKKRLKSDLESYVEALVIAERRHGTNYLGRRTK
ncbi:hypothetical protein D0Z08_17525 [Nocardioides immobilis]|uniref:Uncharacterized protein n=1 Tax=Nocardioides immobilis TaxID=2049295 RepID=A0A417XZR3_9ACTN|nr:hypothetical protein [Nocardioides immobilis]RHW25836.1 hypothetical protein D0Z08_17525 [Nocardioides immobilis]